MSDITISQLDALTSIANDDVLPVYDVSESVDEPTKKITFANLLVGITTLTELTSVVDDDVLLIYDASASTIKKATRTNVVGSGGGGASFPVSLVNLDSKVLSSTDVGKTWVFDDSPSGGGVSVTLPEASTCSDGDVLIIKSMTSETVTISRAGSDAIDVAGITSDTLSTVGDFMQLVCDGSGVWYRVAKGSVV